MNCLLGFFHRWSVVRVLIGDVNTIQTYRCARCGAERKAVVR